MILSTITRKHDLLAKAEQYRHTQIYVSDSAHYVKGILHKPETTVIYKAGENEPLVSPEPLYNLDQEMAWLTVNHYNALVLNTRNMLIADVDFGDHRLNRFAGAKNCDEVLAHLSELHLLDNEHMRFSQFAFAEQTYLVYRTHSGCRVICTSVCVPWQEMGWAAKRFMRFLRSDPEYIQLCGIQKCYRARLMPKPWRNNGEPVHVCEFYSKHGRGDVHPSLVDQLRLHDELTLRENDGWSTLA